MGHPGRLTPHSAAVGILLDDVMLHRRRELASGALAPLADSLTADLTWAMSVPPHSPPKARLTRAGGWCPRDGTLLTFHPDRPHEHACRRCLRVFGGDDHYGWWAMGWQLWLAERVLHAAVLNALRPDAHRAAWAAATLGSLARRYLTWPNSDNVLGPSRPFFSTYLESLWLLHLCLALDILESCGVPSADLHRVRDRLVEPSAELIGSYNEGGSNRQVWNAAALLAAGLVLGQADRVEHAVHGPGGLLYHLRNGLLRDGSWFEGENYHQFAQRGLWYGIALHEAAGGELPPALEARWRLSAGTVFRTALPDLTIPARRDSQWNVSLRQWRFAELAELGLALNPDDSLLSGALTRLYDNGESDRDTGRSRSTGEAERNEPPSALTRAALGWRSLLFALELPPLSDAAPAGSVLLPEQGYAILRSGDDRTYAAMEYGQGGGGHGHPDRLGIVLQRGDARWLQDPGTGSYTDRSLHWYRSTLAHCAPLVGGRTQLRVAGELIAFDRDGAAQFTSARVDGLAPGVTMRRTIVLMPGYMIDELAWSGAAQPFVDLPLHTHLEPADTLTWEPVDPRPETDADAGYEFLTAAERAMVPDDDLRLMARAGVEAVTIIVPSTPGIELWRAMAPGPPGEGSQRMYLLRVPWDVGRLAMVWCWREPHDRVRLIERAPRGGHPAALTLRFHDGASHTHLPVRDSWTIQATDARGAPIAGWSLGAGLAGGSSVAADTAGGPPPDQIGRARATDAAETPASAPERHIVPLVSSSEAVNAAGLRFALAEPHWRGSEQSWAEAEAPSATVSMGVVAGRLVVHVDVEKDDPVFAPRRRINPLDNEHPDINSDGVQLHIDVGDSSLAWILVPDPGAASGVRCTPRTEGASRVRPAAQAGSMASGWWLRAELALDELRPPAVPRERAVPGDARAGSDLAADSGALDFRMDVLVNEIPRDRERRRGQLVLSGARGERVWLRGDRQDPARFMEFRVLT